MLSTSRSATRSEVDAPAPPSGPGVSSPVAGVPTPYAEVSHGLSYVGWLSRSRVSTVDLQVFRCWFRAQVPRPRSRSRSPSGRPRDPSARACRWLIGLPRRPRSA